MFLTLMYHMVDRTIDSRIAVTEEAFEAQLGHLRGERHPILTLDEVVGIAAGGGTAPPRAVFVTFDDAYVDNLYAALPRLREYDVEATVFVPTAHVGQTNRWNPMACYDTRHLDWGELERWVEGGGRVGGHTHEHLCVTRLKDDELHTAIHLNRTTLQQHLGVDVQLFSYPFGVASDAAHSQVAELYDAAFVVRTGTWDARKDRFRINRLPVERSWSLDEFTRQVEAVFASFDRSQGAANSGR